MKENHEFYIQKCFDLALKAKGYTSPNPLVGCVIVKDNKIIATGFHRQAGMAHAELDAIQNAKESLQGATLYCNLEPCCHSNKKTPPCAQRIVKEGISKVVISNLDPNPAVAGNGVKLLQEAGIEVITGILESVGVEINRHFFHHIQSETPYIHLKWAQTLDGKIATLNGDSKWITNEVARAYVHEERLFYDAIMVGSQTANNDNPQLTIRRDNQVLKCPKRIILAPSTKLREDLNLLHDQYKSETIVISQNSYPQLDSSQLMQCLRDENGRIDLNNLLIELKKSGINSIYVEGGGQLLSSFLQHDLYHEISLYIAPKVLGAGKSVLSEIELNKIKESKHLKLHQTKQFGDNVMLNFRK